MNKLPLARSSDVVIQELGKEILIYDLNLHKAYNLNETCSVVYLACNGQTPFDDLKNKYKFTDEIIFLALDELKKENLLEENVNYHSPFVSMNRRDVIRRIGLASIIALPVISSLVAPTSAMAQSPAATCLTFSQSFELSPTPFFATIELCVSALISQAATVCCSGTLNPQAGFEFGTNPELCRGFCGGLPD